MRLVPFPSPGNCRNDGNDERPAQRATHRAEAELASTLGGREAGEAGDCTANVAGRGQPRGRSQKAQASAMASLRRRNER